MNKNIKERDEILFGEYKPDAYRYGGIRYFSRLDVSTLKRLIDANYIELDECQNYSPTTEDFCNFMETHPEFTDHGYAISDKRDDYRITIEGIESDEKCKDPETVEEFIALCRFADEFNLNTPYAWWD